MIEMCGKEWKQMFCQLHKCTSSHSTQTLKAATGYHSCNIQQLHNSSVTNISTYFYFDLCLAVHHQCRWIIQGYSKWLSGF